VPVSQLPSQPTDSNSSAATDVTPVVALKELVARLHREQNKIQDLLSSLGFALRSFNNLNQFLELIPLMATRVTDADGSALFLYKANGQVRLEQLHWQDSHQRKHIRKALETATSQITLLANTAPLANTGVLDAQMHRYLGPDMQIFGTAILVKHAERGWLYVFSRDREYTWTETRQKLVRLVADQTAVAIENDELAVELRKKERLDQELEIAAEIQRRLLPRQCPLIPGIALAARCKPANRVGGDYYDFIPTKHNQFQLNSKDIITLETGRWGFVIGDVMGKGVPAGLIMTMMRGMLRGEVLHGNSPAAILQNLNQVMYADLENSHRFVTLFYSEYDPKNRILSYSNAAHNPPLWWHAATKTVTRLDTLGMLIGLDTNSEYEDAQVQLEPGDTIIYYTDGLTEAASAGGDRFDEENFVDAFNLACKHCNGPQEILDYLFNQVDQFIGADKSQLSKTMDYGLLDESKAAQNRIVQSGFWASSLV
jgi:phosphoserine phosphatase RsbU/P